MLDNIAKETWASRPIAIVPPDDFGCIEAIVDFLVYGGTELAVSNLLVYVLGHVHWPSLPMEISVEVAHPSAKTFTAVSTRMERPPLSRKHCSVSWSSPSEPFLTFRAHFSSSLAASLLSLKGECDSCVRTFMNKNAGGADGIIALPKGGGALRGIGEKFSPDLHTGTGNFTVPIALPFGRNGLQPQLNLVYSSGNGNGPYGLGWNLGIPGVSRKTSKGVPRYDDSQDVFILSGVEDLVSVPGGPAGAIRYRPRTEGLFAQIIHHRDADNDYWEVRSTDGLVSLYGTPAAMGTDPAVIADPVDRTKIFAWKLTQTQDPFGNRIVYEYERDTVEEGPHHSDQLYLKRIRYVDYEDAGQTNFLVSVSFEYDDRPDAFSEYRSGFEIRTRKRCSRVEIRTHAEEDRLVRVYHLIYFDQRAGMDHLRPLNGVSLLNQIEVVGHDGDRTEELPPLEFGYTRFEPQRRDFFPLQGADLPSRSLNDPDMELVDLFGNGLPDVLEMNGTARYWRNCGNGKFALPREMKDAPAGLRLSDSGVQLVDVDGDGRTDLMVSTETLSGYFPLRFGGLWDRRSFQRYRRAPSFNLEDPEVRLLDLDGDGVTDAVRSGTRLECFFNDPKEGWNGTRFVERRAIEEFPNINLSDPRVRSADMTADGLQDFLLVYDGNIEYWPNLGHGRWGKRISMRNSPRFPYGYDPKRILIGDVDGDGLADLVYVDHCKVLLWINQSGNGWSDPIEIQGTPPVTDMDAVRLADVLGTGVSGVLWSADVNGLSRQNMFFLDFTGGIKPYLLQELNNHMGAVTRVEYRPSTYFYLEDQKRPETRWKTPLPFPVQVAARVEVIDEISKGKLTIEYRYHHGYWDGAEREFRGFGMVEQFDTETFDDYVGLGLHEDAKAFAPVGPLYFSPPTLTKTWFHQGPVGEEFGDWQELDYSYEYWSGDPQVLNHSQSVNAFLKTLTDRRVKRDALRTLSGSVLRTELYAQDGSLRAARPYTVTEFCFGLREESPPGPDDKQRLHLFFPQLTAQRTTQWERGDDPMTQFTFTDDYDEFGQPRRQTQIACPRGWREVNDQPGDPYLATRTGTVYAMPVEPQVHTRNRVAKTTTYELENTTGKRVFDLANLLDTSPDLKVVGQTLNYYDGDAFVGLPFGQVGKYGALARTESLVLTDDILSKAYRTEPPPYLAHNGDVAWTEDYPQGFRDQMPTQAGYTFHSGSPYESGFYATTERRRYDFHDDPNGSGKGLVTMLRDPLGRDTTIVYDQPYQLLPEEVVDSVGLKTRAKYNYRFLQSERVTNINGNHTEFTFTPLGLPETTSVKGKAGEGDQQQHSVVMDYNFRAFEESHPDNRQPTFVRTTRRVHHDTEIDVPMPQRDETIETVEYSDGFGRLLQTRAQGEAARFGDEPFGGGESVLPAKQSDGLGSDVIGRENTDLAKPNVVVTGWQIYDNKGRVVEKYEPFFSEGWDYAQPQDQQLGQKAAVFYDPRGQVIRTLNPDGSERRAVYGVPEDLNKPEQFTPTPWEAYTYDANDLAPLSQSPNGTSLAESAPASHHFTPSSILIDALGRTVETTERNGPIPATDWYVTRSTYDIRGNLLVVNDALRRDAFKHIYDLANRPVRIESIDAGVRRIVLDVTGNVIEGRDSKGALALRMYDVMNRPTRLWARDGSGQSLTLRERLVYGDSPGLGLSPTQIAEANLLGRLYQHFDEAGLLAFEAHDFKGNVLQRTRRVISDAAILAVFDSPPPDWQVNAFRVDWDSPDATLLEPPTAAYTTALAYDALNRVKTMQYPEDVSGERKILRPHYNRAGALDRIDIDATSYVEQIAYNAKGQRTLIAYGNGVMTRYAYDPQAFRLGRMCTGRYTMPANLLFHPNGSVLQDFAYHYDLAGNILRLADRTPGCGVIDTPLGADALNRDFTYDPLYRLASAKGRECKDIPKPRPWTDDQRCSFNSGNHGVPNQETAPILTALYQEEYSYDPVGNMLTLKHSNNGDAWIRHFGMGGLTPQQWKNEWPNHLGTTQPWSDPPGNRLTHVGDDTPATSQTHFHDENGNLVRETVSRHFEWDHDDRMRVYRTQTGDSQPSVHTHYLYDTSGQRVKKLVRKQGGQVEVTAYIDGIFEHHRIIQGGTTQENNTLHVMDNQSRIAMLRVGNPFSDDTTPALRFCLGDHLGSSNIVISNTGDWINREEYTPYGETTFASFAHKRYRFTGKERDEESGLYYHGARYYAPWLSRWTTTDPVSHRGGNSDYEYANNNPVCFTDPDGRDTKESLNRAREYTRAVAKIGKEYEAISKGVAAEVANYNTALDQYTRSRNTDMGAVEKMERAKRALEYHEASLKKLEARVADLNKNPSATKVAAKLAGLPDATGRPAPPLTRGEVLAAELELSAELEKTEEMWHKDPSAKAKAAQNAEFAKKAATKVRKADDRLRGFAEKVPKARSDVSMAVKRAGGVAPIPTAKTVARAAGKAMTVLFLWDLARAKTPEETHQIVLNTALFPITLPIAVYQALEEYDNRPHAEVAPGAEEEHERIEAQKRREGPEAGGSGTGSQ
jgi:RHS repeat-associated protein